MAEEKRPRGRPRKDGKMPGTVPPKPKGQLGGAREGAGRPKGSRNIFTMASSMKGLGSQESVKKLEELGFDPIEQMVNLYQEIADKLTDGSVRPGSGAYAQLLSTQGTLINNLMQYGYKRVPEKQEIEVENKKPLAVKLNLKGGDNEKD